MSTALMDADRGYASVVHHGGDEAKISPAPSPPGRKTVPGHLKLTRSLSKSDSDLLASPLAEEDGALNGRSESVTDCNAERTRMERLPSFASEWDEIEKIMNLIGAGIDLSEEASSAPTDGACGRALEQPVGEWLEHVGLPQYESKLLLNGFDDLRFMGSNVMEDEDLQEIGITDPGHRKKILHAARNLPKVKALGCDGSTSLASWLDTLGLQEYLHNFLSCGYRTLDCVKNLWELEMVNVLKIGLLGHRKRIIASLAERPYEEAPTKNSRLSQFKIQDLLSQTPSPLSYMDPSTSRSMDTLLPLGEYGRRSRGMDQDCSVSLRSYSERPRSHYLGSMIIKDLRGIESTQEACARIRKSKDHRKGPVVILSITYKGVKFIDAATKTIVAEHEIQNISCAAQDPDDLRTFAYITKDLMSSHHICHVFSTVEVTQTYEIILTLGQAFEVAYQMALKAQRARRHSTYTGPASEVIETKSSRPSSQSRSSMRRSMMDPAELEADVQSTGSTSWLFDPRDSSKHHRSTKRQQL